MSIFDKLSDYIDNKGKSSDKKEPELPKYSDEEIKDAKKTALKLLKQDWTKIQKIIQQECNKNSDTKKISKGFKITKELIEKDIEFYKDRFYYIILDCDLNEIYSNPREKYSEGTLPEDKIYKNIIKSLKDTNFKNSLYFDDYGDWDGWLMAVEIKMSDCINESTIFESVKFI